MWPRRVVNLEVTVALIPDLVIGPRPPAASCLFLMSVTLAEMVTAFSEGGILL